MARLEIRQRARIIRIENSFFFFLLLAITTLMCASSDCIAQPPAACDACGPGEACGPGTCGPGGKYGPGTWVAECATERLHCSSQRLLPSGDLMSRIPYTGMQQYYYRRPYSPLHVPAKTYSRDGFEEVYKMIESGVLEHSPEGIVSNDRAFEFSDWQEHRRARLAWEAETVGTMDIRQATTNEGRSQTLSDLLK